MLTRQAPLGKFDEAELRVTAIKLSGLPPPLKKGGTLNLMAVELRVPTLPSRVW